MKKILLLIIVFYPFLLSAQPSSGDGTAGNPYTGVITTPWTLIGDIYCGDLTVSSGTFTINAGATLRFGSGNSLTISGTGVLTAVGNNTSYITFTASGTTWGHIAFSDPASTGSSSLDYCIIESGSVSGSGYTGAGGGILIRHNYVTVSNSILRNNSSDWGGGIFIDNYRNPLIYNCQFTNNTTVHGGGAIYCWNGVSSIIENCIFDSNHCTETSIFYYSGGAISAQISTSIQVLNCTFVNNTSTQTEGQGILLQNSSGSSIINCIFWGASDKQIYCYGTTSANIIINCAYRGITYASGNPVNPVVLNSNNTASDGPNFVDPSNSNYSIAFVSPCRDAGTTPSPPVPYDIIGNPRVGPYDIGAYEVQFNNSWTGATNEDWFTPGNWATNYVPGKNSLIVIGPSAHDPVIAGTNPASINSLSIESTAALTVSDGRTLNSTNVQNSGTLTVTAGATLIVTTLLNAGTFILQPTGMTTTTALTNNGTINLNSNIDNMFSLIFDSYSGTGTANVAMTLTGGGGDYHWAWHYVAIPTPYPLDKSVFTGIEPYNFMEYDDANIPNTLTATDNDGWIWHDGYITGPPSGMGGPSFSNLESGRGYAFYHGTNTTVNFLNLTSLVPNLGTSVLQYHGTDKLVPTNYGYNLLGNSLTCGIDVNNITFSGNVNTSVYYTINYKIGNYVQNGGSINGATKDIPPLQGFLVRAYDVDASLDFANAREHTSQIRYKRSLETVANDSKGSSSSNPNIKLELDNPGNQDETAIWFNQNATKSFDPSYDGLKILSTGYDQIYSWSGTLKYGINAMPLPTDIQVIPLAVKFLNGGSSIKIVASQLVGLDNYNVTLTDKANSDFTVDLKNTNSYTFSSDAGTFPDRFVLTVGTISTNVSDVIVTNKDFNVYAYANTLNIDLLNPEWSGINNTINLYDLTGRKIIGQDNVELVKGDLKKIPLNLPQGIYIVEIKAENRKFVTKINIIK